MSTSTFTFAPSVTCISQPPVKDKVRVHVGMCQVGLFMTFSGGEAPGDWLLREVISLWQGVDEFSAEIALVKPLTSRMVINGLYVPVTAEEGHALQVLCREAEDYFKANHYDTDYSSRAEYLLGTTHIPFLAHCWHPEVQLRTALPVGLHKKPRRRYV